jgi:hypothetical protein
MNITIDFSTPLKEDGLRKYVEDVGLSTEPPLKCFGGQIFSQSGNCGRVKVTITESRTRIVIKTHYLNAHRRSYQLLRLAQGAVTLGDDPVVTFSQEFVHMDLRQWFPSGKFTGNQIYLEGISLSRK